MRQRLNARLTARAIAQRLCCAALVLLPACQPSGPDAPFEIYLSKLGAALSVAPSLLPDAAPTPPMVATLQQAMPASPIDRLDLLQLSGCAVQANIGRRQSSLGQFAKPSQRLFLELEFLRLAPACSGRLRDGNQQAVADMLDAAWREKQAQLPALVFNATLGGDEYRAYWLPRPAPGDYPRSRPDAAAAAMVAINDQVQRWLHGDYRARNRDFELLLSAVAGGEGGIRLRDWSRQIEFVAASDRMLEQALAAAGACLRHPRGNAARRSVAEYFTATIQPLTTRSQQRYQATTTAALALETLLNTGLPAHYRQWMEDRNQHVATLARAPARHLERLEAVHPACAPD